MNVLLAHAAPACVLLSAGLGLAVARAWAKPRRLLRDLAASEEGAALVEFALAAPVLLAVVLLIAQLALVAVARRAVEGAAFAAARSAAVWVPADIEEGANALRLTGRSSKRERIERAAALALLAVAPEEPAGPSGREEPEVADALRALARDTAIAPPESLLRRYASARARLHIGAAVAGLPPGDVIAAGPDDPLTITVSYDCPLNVPLVARVLGLPDRESGRFQAPLTARCTMRNEGTKESPLELPAGEP